MKELYYNNKLLWGVFFDEEKDKYFIEVECGGVAMHSVRLPLTPEEVNKFKQGPENLNALSYDIARNSEKYVRERGS